MKRLKKQSSDIENFYALMCEAVADDLQEQKDLTLDDFAKQTVEAIKSQQFLSDFEKTVRDYFKVKNLTLKYETLVDDISKFL